MSTHHRLPTGDQLMLQTYLNDHRAGAAAGLALCERLAASNAGTELGETVSEICVEIAEDAASLDRIIEHLGLHQNPVKRTLALAAERLGRLKLNGQIKGYSPLSRLLEVEGLIAGIDAKRSLWRSLHAATPDGRVGDADLHRLTERADAQRERLLPHHDEAATNALATPLLDRR
jgi:hypothetical protein